jgi:lysine 2,3-aminomutase
MVESVGAYMQGHPGIREVLVSGGDPLTATDTKLEWLFAALRSARPGILIRLCTRAPVTLPSRVTPGLLGLVRRFRPLVVVVQVNHPKELAGEGGQALGALADVGIGVRSQTVLLRGVNDEAQALEELFVGLTRLGVMPYYLFQADLARGTGHFRVPLSRGLELYASLRRRCSGLELPRYAVDAPGGGGKVHLPEGIVGRSGDGWMLAAPDGSRAVYPEETDGDGT